MATSFCGSTKAAFLKALSAHTSAKTRGNVCVLTLPLRTLDGRFIEVFVEQKLGDSLLVHDAGKTAGELHLQGLHWTESRYALLAAIADKFGATLSQKGVFQIACKADVVADAILAVSQCAAVGVFEIAQHAPVVEDAPVAVQVKRAMRRWNPSFLDVDVNVRIKGANGADHLFDCVAHHKDAKHQTVAIKTLPFGYGARVQADRYGFMVLDVKGTLYDKWRRLAVVSQVERWPLPSLKIVRKFSARTLELRSGEDNFKDEQLTDHVREMAYRRKSA